MALSITFAAVALVAHLVAVAAARRATSALAVAAAAAALVPWLPVTGAAVLSLAVGAGLSLAALLSGSATIASLRTLHALAALATLPALFVWPTLPAASFDLIASSALALVCAVAVIAASARWLVLEADRGARLLAGTLIAWLPLSAAGSGPFTLIQGVAEVADADQFATWTDVRHLTVAPGASGEFAVLLWWALPVLIVIVFLVAALLRRRLGSLVFALCSISAFAVAVSLFWPAAAQLLDSARGGGGLASVAVAGSALPQLLRQSAGIALDPTVILVALLRIATLAALLWARGTAPVRSRLAAPAGLALQAAAALAGGGLVVLWSATATGWHASLWLVDPALWTTLAVLLAVAIALSARARGDARLADVAQAASLAAALLLIEGATLGWRVAGTLLPV